MKPMSKSSTVAVFTFLGLVVPALLLSGCAGNINFPDTVVPGTAQQTSVGAIQGSVYGGHAPLASSHVYVLQAGTGGYGTQATSLLGASASTVAGSETFQNVNDGTYINYDPGVPVGAYYVKTDGGGQFNITGDYTCTAGLPVYLYAHAGYPAFPQASGFNTDNTFNVQSVSVSGTGPYTYTFTFTTQSFNFANQPVFFNQAYGPFTAGSPYNAQNAYIVASAPAPGQITIQSNSNTTGSTNGLQLTFATPYNTDIVNLAVLGICPSTGSLQAGGTIFNGTTSAPLNYVYMNEVSTVAAAYAFAPFSANAALNSSFSSTTNYASYVGTSSTNLVGLQNAALNAGQLYSVNGTGPISTVFEGEGHVANATTPTGNGIINQAAIDTVANILASCVDSWSGSVGTSAQCGTLFQYATNTGIPTSDTGFNPGTAPNDTATAAINIALHPQGPPATDTNTTPAAWVAALYNLPTAAVPFTPNLTSQPNDFTIGILYTAANYPASQATSYFNGITGVAVDKIGEVWFNSEPSATSGWVFKMLPQGVIDPGAIYWNGTYTPGPPVIDSNENIWYHTQDQQGPVYFISTKSTSGNPYTYNNYATATPDGNGYFYSGTVTYFGDNNGNMYFVHDQTAPGASGSSTSVFQLSKFPAISGGSSTDAGEVNIANFVNTNYAINAGALDNQGYAWLVQNETGSGNSNVGRVGQVPSASNSFYLSGSNNCAGLDAPTGIAITRYGNAVVADSVEFAVTFVTSSGACTFLQNSTGNSINRTGPGSYLPVAEATDGNDYVYSLNQDSGEPVSHQGSITVFNLQGESGGAGGVYAMNYALSPVYYPSGSSTLTSMLSIPQSMALDPSGNIWVVNSTSSGPNPNSIVEIIGAAAPTTTPLSGAINSICRTVTTFGCIGFAP